MMIGIRRYFRLAGLAIAATGAIAIGASAASAQQSFAAPAPDGYPPNWNRPAPSTPSTAAFVPGSDAYHWVNDSGPAQSASTTAAIYQMVPGSTHYHRVQ